MQLDSWDSEDQNNTGISIFESWNYQEIKIFRDQARVQRNISMDWMVNRSIVPNVRVIFNIGDRVVRRVFLDNNRNTRRRELNDNIYFGIYRVSNIDENENITITSKGNLEFIINDVSIRDLRKLYDY
ncbi:hypothetical protein DMUE_4911 [Dictyocoela muelleri]|nr:hypothetical protein DMUE_4911 [Dictyocoela muelleri]